jgi:hypothetical protein
MGCCILTRASQARTCTRHCTPSAPDAAPATAVFQGFEEAGLLLLKAAVRSNPVLSTATMRRVVVQLVTGEALAGALTAVLCRQMLVPADVLLWLGRWQDGCLAVRVSPWRVPQSSGASSAHLPQVPGVTEALQPAEPQSHLVPAAHLWSSTVCSSTQRTFLQKRP